VVVVVTVAGFVLALARPSAVVAVVRRCGTLVLRSGWSLELPEGALRRSLLLSVAGWLITGTHVWVLVVGLGADPVRALPAAVGGLALATVVGSLVIIAPGGIGVRELVLIAALSTVVQPATAAVVAVASRLVTVVGELLVASAATLLDTRADDTPASPGTTRRTAPQN